MFKNIRFPSHTNLVVISDNKHTLINIDGSLNVILSRARISKTDRGLTFYEGCRPMLSFVGLVALFYAWLLLSPAGILELQPRMFFTATGIVFSNITVSLSQKAFDILQVNLILWILGTLGKYCGVILAVKSLTVGSLLACNCQFMDACGRLVWEA